ncbi:MAG TPA: YciI family protein [Pyrinomonadaceae bacterium]|nr:YciI family protein [Pyrinomonadaceae bacterium]HEU4871866.1 YciI family protein [Pyrinomonadaceae bacterium]
MRVMVIIKANKESEAGVMPSEKLLTDMGKFNEELVNAGIMLDGEGLHPSSKAKRVRFSGGNRIVTDGPFAETRELIAGYWIWKVNSMDEAIEWVKRIPFDPDSVEGDGEVEIRQIFEAEDFGAEFTPELREQEDRVRAQAAKLKEN